MHFLKNNRQILSVAFVFPLFFLYIDRSVILWMRGFHTDGMHLYALLHSVDPLIEFIAHGATLIAGAFLLYLIGRFFQPRLYDMGRTLFAGLVSAGISAQALKHLIGRARPRLTDDSIFIGPSLRSGYDSFPSGHTTLAFCLAYILSQYFPRYRTPLHLFALVVSLERVEDLAHFPSDVLAGALVGLMVGKLFFLKTAYPGENRYAGEN
jgi:undecaprenyl-diphosphatase